MACTGLDTSPITRAVATGSSLDPSRIAPSLPPVASCRPSGLNARPHSFTGGPLATVTGRKSGQLHRITVPS